LGWYEFNLTTSPRTSAPHVLETNRTQFGIAGGVLDGPVPEPILNQPGVMAGVGQRVATGMAQHVGVDLEGEAGALVDTLHKAVDGVRSEWAAAFRLEDEDTLRTPLQFAQGRRLRAFI